MRTSLALFQPFSTDGLPAISDIVRAKYRYAKTRWRETPEYATFQTYQDRKFASMGWTGQVEAPGYALQVLAKSLNHPEALALARKSLDFLSTATF